jgi:NADPH2:quinone reductase
MQAVLLHASAVTLAEIPLPAIASPQQVLVALKAAGVNPLDTKLRQRGTFYPEQMPAILGCDGAGIVAAVGSGVTQYAVGDEVYFYAGGLGKTGTGNYAQYTLVEEHLLAPKPRSLSFAEAAVIPLALITAWESLYERVNLEAGQTVLIHGGAGGVGHLAIQLAKLRGAQVVTTVSSPDKERLVRQLGADYPIFYEQTDFVKAVLSWTGGQGVDVVFDTVGGVVFWQSCLATKVYGDIVTILEPDFNLGNLKQARNRNLRISLELMLTPALLNIPSAQAHQGEILRQASQLFDTGKLQVHLSQTFPLAEAALAHQVIETGSVMGKIALIP